MGCELPPAEALAADEQITARARELSEAGLEGAGPAPRPRLPRSAPGQGLPSPLGRERRARTSRPGPGRLGRTAPARSAAPAAGSPAGSPGPSRWRPWPGWPTGPANSPAWARSTRGWPATWPPPPRRNPKTTWCVTATESRATPSATAAPGPNPGHRKRAGPARRRDRVHASPRPAGTGRPAATAPGGCAPLDPGPDLIITMDPLTTDPCDHRYEAKGHDPGAKLRHLSQVRHATCTSPVCRGPAAQCDHEHNTPYEAGGRTCLCNTGPKCRHDHRLKQHPKWKVDQLPERDPSPGPPRRADLQPPEPTRYPI